MLVHLRLPPAYPFVLLGGERHCDGKVANIRTQSARYPVSTTPPTNNENAYFANLHWPVVSLLPLFVLSRKCAWQALTHQLPGPCTTRDVIKHERINWARDRPWQKMEANLSDGLLYHWHFLFGETFSDANKGEWKTNKTIKKSEREKKQESKKKKTEIWVCAHAPKEILKYLPRSGREYQ